jgi:hypothetical protein
MPGESASLNLSRQIQLYLVNFLNNGNPLKMYNIYRGLPISYPVSLAALEQDRIILKVHKYQATCLELQRWTFLDGDGLPRAVQAVAVSIFVSKEQAALYDFSYASPGVGKRSLVRVQPRDPIPVKLVMKSNQVRGQLADISIEGAGVYTSAIFYGQGGLTLNAGLEMVIQFPDSPRLLKMQAMVVNVVRHAGQARLGVMAMPDAADKQVIAQFIARRQAEIQRELQEAYQALYRMEMEDAQQMP